MGDLGGCEKLGRSIIHPSIQQRQKTYGDRQRDAAKRAKFLEQLSDPSAPFDSAQGTIAGWLIAAYFVTRAIA